jgi:hypothetical protein
MVTGLITGREIILNSWTICRSFGPSVYFRCLGVALQRRSRTFLDILRLTQGWEPMPKQGEQSADRLEVSKRNRE